MGTVYNAVTGVYDYTDASGNDTGVPAGTPYGPQPAPAGQTGGPAPTPGATSGGVGLSGISGLFSAVGSAFSSGYKAVAGPTVVQPGPGTLVYNPQTGQLQSVAGIQAAGTASAISPLLLLALGALVIYMLLKEG